MIGALAARLVSEVTISSGIGDYVLSSGVPGAIRFRDFLIDGEEISYTVSDGVRSEDVDGVFIYPDRLWRTTVISSTNNNEKIDWPSQGQRIVQLILPDKLGNLITEGSIPFVGGGGLLDEDNSGLFWDRVNRRLGIRTNIPDVHLDLAGNIIRWGMLTYPAQYGFLGSPNNYLIGDAGDTSSDVSFFMRVNGNGRWEAGMVGAITDGVLNQSYRIKEVSGSYPTEVFEDRFVIHGSTSPRYSFIDIHGPSGDDAKLRLFGITAGDLPMLVMGNSNGIDTGSGLELSYDFNSDISRITSITHGAYYRDFVIEGNNIRFSTGPVFLNVNAFVINAQGAVKAGDAISLADYANISNGGPAGIALMSGYVPGEILTAVGGTGTAPTFSLTNTLVSRVNSIASAGTGGTNSTQTTLLSSVNTGATSISVASITGFANGDKIDIELATGLYHETTVNGVPSGNTIVLSAGLVGPALSGGDVWEGRTVVGTSGTGTKLSLSVAIVGGVVSQALFISDNGDYTVNPSSLTNEPVTGSGLTGAQINISMGAKTLSTLSVGSLSVQPITPVSSTSSGGGTGATLDIFYQNGLGSINALEYWANGNRIIDSSGNWIGSETITTASKTIDYVVLTTDNLTNFNNIGAAGTVVFSLPAASAGRGFTFVVFVAQILRIDADGSDLIKSGTAFSAGDIESNEPYSSITLRAHGSGIWVVNSTTGNWS